MTFTQQPPPDAKFSKAEVGIWDSLLAEKENWTDLELRRAVELVRLLARIGILSAETARARPTVRNPSGRIVPNPKLMALHAAQRSAAGLRRELLPRERQRAEDRTAQGTRTRLRGDLTEMFTEQDLLAAPDDDGMEKLIDHNRARRLDDD